ncbi:MAG TPA: PQQ-dependent dehydrogenase, methanol/ethanol family [Candidatus Cybelea sp.]|nr:PQQ-dependent dehydrogenase, methanol/ethanol family [Candidatus Cybelea sp.]
MRRWLIAAAVAALVPIGAQAQTADELAKGASDTHNVVNYGMGYSQLRYSTLTQINKQTVKRLVPAWTYSLDDNRSEESQPIVYKGVIYITTNAATMAVDAKTGRQIWKAKVEYPPETARVVCCGIINRGVAIYDGKLFRTTLDANVIALDAKTGKQLWKQNAADIHAGYSATLAPLVADGVVITGISGAELGIRGFIDGWDPADGKHLWRTYTTALPNEPHGDTWAGDSATHGGGSTWITGSFDPELHTVYWGIGNPGSFNAATRKGDNLYTDSILALDPKTGKIKWYYQQTPNDPFDYDSIQELVLTTLKVGGKPTKVLMQANKNGFFYVLDRTNGKLLAANPFVKNVNWAKGIDMKTGRPIETDLGAKARAGEKISVWPSAFGGKNWFPMSYNPKTGLAYANTLDIGMNYKSVPAEYKAGEFYFGIDLTLGFDFPPNNAPRGYLEAIDPLTGKAKWSKPSALPRWSGVLSTAGGVVFTGQLTGEFVAFDADTGAELWSYQTGAGIEGQPVTWEQDGTQYVAVTSGYGGAYVIFTGDERLAATPTGGSLWVFKVMK